MLKKMRLQIVLLPGLFPFLRRVQEAIKIKTNVVRNSVRGAHSLPLPPTCCACRRFSIIDEYELLLFDESSVYFKRTRHTLRPDLNRRYKSRNRSQASLSALTLLNLKLNNKNECGEWRNCIKSSKLTKFIISYMRKVSITWFLCLSIAGLLLPILPPRPRWCRQRRRQCARFYCYDYYCSFENYFPSFISCGAIIRRYFMLWNRKLNSVVQCRLLLCLETNNMFGSGAQRIEVRSMDIHWLPIILQRMKLLGHFHSIWCVCTGDRRSTTVLAWSLFMQKFCNVVDVALHVRTCHFWLAFRMGECSRIQFNFDHSLFALPGSLTISIHLSLSPSVAGWMHKVGSTLRPAQNFNLLLLRKKRAARAKKKPLVVIHCVVVVVSMLAMADIHWMTGLLRVK